MIATLTNYVVPVLHVLACLFLIVVVLLQTGKGADMGAVFGGGSQTLFGSGGAGNFLTKLTTATAILFMVTSLVLSNTTSRTPTSNLLERLPEATPLPIEAPVTTTDAPIEVPVAGETTDVPEESATEDAAAPEPAAQAPTTAPEPAPAARREEVDAPVAPATTREPAPTPSE